MLDFMTTHRVSEPVIVADGNDFTILLPEGYGEEFAGQLRRLVANIATFVERDQEQGVA